MKKRQILLTVAGFDPGSGAGATLDLRVFHHFGYYGLAVLTTLTIQNSFKVYDLKPLPASFILEQYRKLKSDFVFSGIKIGMLGSGQAIYAIEEIISENQNWPVVVDPVFRSSSGRWLLEKKYIASYLKSLTGKIALLTPNLNEASLIVGQKVETVEEMKEAARKISELIGSACLIKGGHLQDQAVDVLYDGCNFHLFSKKKFTADVHGTGCFLSSTILCFLASGLTLSEACKRASQTIHRLLRSPLLLGRRPVLDI